MALAWTIEMSVESAREAEHDEVRLVRASLGGDSEAFASLVRRHQRRVFRLIGRFFRQPEDVEDVAQDVFLTAWRKLRTYRAEAPFEHWITRVCLNRCYERLRKYTPVEQELDDRVEPAAEAIDPTAGVELERLLRSAEPVDRFVLLLLYGEGWTIAEIAERLGWTQVNVKVRAHRARKKLRRILEARP
jgi:RNA polymerase sigma-70 factor (ECF subfamily)